MRLLYVCGITPELPAGLRPLPPLDSGAPHGNIFRLIEYLSHSEDAHDLEIMVVSAASSDQSLEIQKQYPDELQSGKYRLILIPAWLRRLSAWVWTHVPYSDGILNRVCGGYSLQAVHFLRRISFICRQWKPDFVLLDAGAQYIRGLARFISRDQLLFYCRGDMGSSRRHLHYARQIWVTNHLLGKWVRQINPRVSSYAVVRNTLPTEALVEPQVGRRFTRERKNVLFAGRILPIKGVEYLIRSFARLHPHMPEARLILVGAANPGLSNAENCLTQFESDMRTLTSELLPKEAVCWEGWLSVDRLQLLYKEAYMAVYPSNYVEGFGMVALEAMACGLPVIASEQPGFCSLLGEGGGLLVPDPTDEIQLANTMLNLLRDPELAQRLGHQAYEIARQYTVARAGAEFVSAIKALSTGEAS